MPALMSPPTNGAGCGGIHAGGRPGSSAVRASRLRQPVRGGTQSGHIFIQQDGGHGGIPRDAQFRHRTPTSETTRCRKRSRRCPSRSRPS